MRKGNFWTYFSDKGSCGLKTLVFSGTEKELRDNFISEVANVLRSLQKQEPELVEKMFILTEERFQRASYAREAINDQTLSLDERVKETPRREENFIIWEEKNWIPTAELIYNKLIAIGISPEFIL